MEWTPLMWACGTGHLECAQALIEANAAVDVVNIIGKTALMLACFSGHHECAQALIGAGAAVDMVNNIGYTALMLACFSGHLECAQALIGAGAAVDVVNNIGKTALMLACFSGHHECAQALIDAGAAVDKVDNDGKATLMRACHALLESMVLIREVVVADPTASLKLACERHRVLQVVLSTSHIVEFAPAALERARVLVSDVHSIIVDFARDMLIQGQLDSLKLDGLAIVGDSSTCALRAPIEAEYSRTATDDPMFDWHPATCLAA